MLKNAVFVDLIKFKVPARFHPMIHSSQLTHQSIQLQIKPTQSQCLYIIHERRSAIKTMQHTYIFKLTVINKNCNIWTLSSCIHFHNSWRETLNIYIHFVYSLLSLLNFCNLKGYYVSLEWDLVSACDMDTPQTLRHCWNYVCLFVCLFAYSRTSNFLAIWRMSLPGTGLHLDLMAFSSEGYLTCHTYCNTGPRFIRSHLKDQYPRPTMGFEPATQGSSNLCAVALNTAPRRWL
jgi:hypothetical protein